MGNNDSTDEHKKEKYIEFINYATSYDDILTKTAFILMNYINSINFFSKHTLLKTFRELVLFFINSDCLWEYQDKLKSLFANEDNFSSEIFEYLYDKIYRIKGNTSYSRVKYNSYNISKIMRCIYNFLKILYIMVVFSLDISTDDLFQRSYSVI